MSPPPKGKPEDPFEWLKRAKSNLVQAQTRLEGVVFEDLCFNAHQAVEKALKALLLKLTGRFPLTHDVVRLNTEIEKKMKPLPDALANAEFLTSYSVASRYPGWDEPVTETEYQKAVSAAETVVTWVADKLQARGK